MNKKAVGIDFLGWNFIYIVLEIIFFILILYWVVGFQDSAALWEDFYVKEITRLINTAEPGQEVFLDVSPATRIAFSNGVGKSDLFNFNNVNNFVTVKLTPNRGSSFSFFNDVDIVDWDVRLVSGGAETNRLYFKIVEVQKQDEIVS